MSSQRSGVVKNTKKTKKSISKKVVAKSTTAANIEDGQGKRPVYFWRERNHEYGYLSQWYHSPFSDPEEPEIVYQTAEQYMMYQKALLFSDPSTGAKILQTWEPREQKALGRQVQNFSEDIWLKNRERIVEQGSYLKFKYGVRGEEVQEKEQETEISLRERLMRTGERKLVEASPMDRIWGIGFGEKNADGRRDRWGLNLLGICLMRARKRLSVEADEEKGILDGSMAVEAENV